MSYFRIMAKKRISVLILCVMLTTPVQSADAGTAEELYAETVAEENLDREALLPQSVEDEIALNPEPLPFDAEVEEPPPAKSGQNSFHPALQNPETRQKVITVLRRIAKRKKS